MYAIARRLPGVEVIDSICDQLGRTGHGLAHTEHAHRVELIFSPDISQLLGYQEFLAETQSFAPAGTLHSWSAFVARRIVVGLPPEIPRCLVFHAFRQALAAAL